MLNTNNRLLVVPRRLRLCFMGRTWRSSVLSSPGTLCSLYLEYSVLTPILSTPSSPNLGYSLLTLL